MRPGQSIQDALDRAKPGDTVRLRGGLYHETHLVPPNGVRMVSEDGPGAARIDGDGRDEILRLYGSRDVAIEGLEMFHSASNVVKMEQASDILLRDCKIHGAGDGDCVKATVSCRRITLEGCEIFDPGRGGHGSEQNVDFIDVEEGVVRNCLLYHTTRGGQIGYFKGGSRRCRLEGNVVLNALGQGDDSPAWSLGQGTDSAWQRGPYACSQVVVRDNLFIGAADTPVGFWGCRDVSFYNNTLYECGARSGAAFGFHRLSSAGDPAIDEVRIFNNLVVNPTVPLQDLFQCVERMDGRLFHDYNLVWNGARKPPKNARELHGVGAEPRLRGPAVFPSPAEGTRALRERFSLLPGSPGVGQGGDPEALLSPGGRELSGQIFRQPRCRWDIGIS